MRRERWKGRREGGKEASKVYVDRWWKWEGRVEIAGQDLGKSA